MLDSVQQNSNLGPSAHKEIDGVYEVEDFQLIKEELIGT